MIEEFFHLPPVSTTPVVHLEPRIYLRIFEKIWNGPNGILRSLGETDSWTKPEVENFVTLSLSAGVSRLQRLPGHIHSCYGSPQVPTPLPGNNSKNTVEAEPWRNQETNEKSSLHHLLTLPPAVCRSLLHPKPLPRSISQLIPVVIQQRRFSFGLLVSRERGKKEAAITAVLGDGWANVNDIKTDLAIFTFHGKWFIRYLPGHFFQSVPNQVHPVQQLPSLNKTTFHLTFLSIFRGKVLTSWMNYFCRLCIFHICHNHKRWYGARRRGRERESAN